MAPLAIALVAATVASVTDLWKYRIYNVLTLPLLISGLLYHSLALSGEGLVISLSGACLGFGPMALLYLTGGLGAGDVKLMAGLGAWLGPVSAVEILLASWIAAGFYAVGVLVFNAASSHRDRVRYRLHHLATQLDSNDLSQLTAMPCRRRRLIPFGLMIFAGVIVTIISHGNVSFS